MIAHIIRLLLELGPSISVNRPWIRKGLHEDWAWISLWLGVLVVHFPLVLWSFHSRPYHSRGLSARPRDIKDLVFPQTVGGLDFDDVLGCLADERPPKG